MSQNPKYIPEAYVLDAREKKELAALTEKYEKLTEPGLLARVGNKIVSLVPEAVQGKVRKAADSFTEAELFQACMKVVASGFQTLEEQAAKVTVDSRSVVQQVDKQTEAWHITSIEEVCFARSYEVARLVNRYKTGDRLFAAAEGGGTGFFGFAGILPNLVLSTFLFYRAVQSVAICYGYDVPNEDSELMIASEVFGMGMGGEDAGGEMAGVIGKIMLFSEATTIRQLSRQSWTEIASHGGFPLLLAQLRALSNAAARQAVERAGQETLEKSVFRSLFTQIGKRLSKSAIERSVPVLSAGIGALFDVGMMDRVLNFADIFYHKRFILEKEEKIQMIMETSRKTRQLMP